MEQNMSARSGKPSVYIRLSPSVSAALHVAARGADLSRAGWVRERIVQSLPASDEASLTLPASPRRRPTVIPSTDLIEVARLAGVLARNNGALVQLTKAMREIGSPFHPNAEAVLADLRLMQEVLLTVVTSLRHRMDT